MSTPNVQRTSHAPRKLRQGSGADTAGKAKDTAEGIPNKLQQTGNTVESKAQEQGGDSGPAAGLSGKVDQAAGAAKDNVPDKAKDAADTATDTAKDVPGKLEKESGVPDKAKGAADTATDTAKDIPGKVGEESGLADKTKEAAGDVKGAANDTGLPDKAKETAETAKDTAKGTDVPDKANEATETAKDTANGTGLPDKANDAASQAQGTAETSLPESAQETTDQVKNTGTGTVTNLSDLDGLPVSGDGVIKNPSGIDVGKVVEGDPSDLEGYVPNGKGEILDDDGDLVGRVEAIPQDVQGGVDQVDGDVPKDVKDAANKPNGVQEPIDKANDISQDAKGAVDKPDGVNPQDTQEPMDKANAAPEAAKNTINKTKDTISNLADLQGIPIGEGGNITDKAGREIGKVVEGDPEDLIGYSPNDKGEILDDDGDLIGVVQLNADTESLAQDGVDGVDGVEETADTAKDDVTDKAKENIPDLPPLSTLEGLQCTKLGKIVNNAGKPVGELIEGDAKKLARFGAPLDDKGQFWDNRGNVIGKAQTLAQNQEDEEEEPPFAGLEGLHVVEDGWVEDEQGMRVGKIVEGDAARLLGRSVDADGDVIDSRGSVIARAEYYKQPDEPEPETVDLSPLDGLTCNKMGFVIGPEGIPIARVVEGNPRELSGKKIDDGQIWDGRNPVGRVLFRS